MKIVVVGNGMVGCRFLQALENASKEHEIIVFGEEPRPAYDRVHLSEFFSGKSAEDLLLKPLEWYQEMGFELKMNEKVTSIDREHKKVITSKGECSYDKLVLATGSSPFVPPIPGNDKAGVFVYRTIEDLEAMMAWGARNEVASAAVVGGGLLGLEAAKALVDMNLQTHVVEFAPRLMPRQIDDSGSQILVKKIEELGVQLHLSRGTKEIVGDVNVESMVFSEEESLPVDMVVISAGIRPRDELAKASELDMGERGGIVVNDHLQTSDPDIYAIGECALHEGMIYGLVAPGYRMAEAAVAHLLESSEPSTFAGADMSTKLKLMGVDVASIGNPGAQGDHIHSVEILDRPSLVYKRLLIDSNTNTLAGAILVGNADEYGSLLQLYLGSSPLPESPLGLIAPAGEGAVSVGVDAMDDSAQICSCENVCKGDIVAAIEDGAKDVPSIKACTKAGTGCGSCVTLVTDLLNSELEKSGETIDTSLCEHFSYTRQELLEIVKVKRIKSFDELIDKHGQGHGCEICRPAVASILASVWNEYILHHTEVQDTNDAFLANMQKNGTYSVVPRVPGGELTPLQLIRIGEVARDFDLYTKITGGQRIDLFGARLEHLPDIWESLGEVGLESGHAYAKALRTVKSCVGSTWCRFGVQDSTEMAIRLENRYKGLRAPHKIKFAVSGCARECAEAQGKDIGVIATEKGWNLYVCGNGGMVPQHAKLILADTNDETLIRTIDRVLMFYVRTADRLTRTATWLNKLPGGLDHLKDVVLEDSLNICDTLEKEMQHIIDTYQCEWKSTYTDPAKRARFRHFVNDDKGDPNVSFTRERDQIQPAPPKATQPQPQLVEA